MLVTDKLKNVRFVGLPEVDWSIVLKRRGIELECNTKTKYMKLKSYLRPFVSNKLLYNFVKSGAKVLTMQENSMFRANYEKQMNAVRSLVPNDSLQSTVMKRSIHIIDGIILFFYIIPLWKKQLNKANIKGYDCNSIIQVLINLYFFYKEYLSKIECSNYNLLLVFYDSSIHESLAVEVFKKEGIKTATLQHGIFSARSENTFINSGVELRSFHSDYFLCWNQMTIDEAVKQGIDTSSFIPCGILGFVGQKYCACIEPDNKTFGVVIGHPSFEDENMKLIEGANIIAKHLGYHYYLKLHPNYEIHYFDSFVDNHYYLGTIEKGISMLKYANSVEFSICGSSSVFAELVYLNHNLIRYSSQGKTDKFKNIKCGKYFSTPSDIIDVYGIGFDGNGMNDVFNQVCYTTNVTESYKKFLTRFVD